MTVFIPFQKSFVTSTLIAPLTAKLQTLFTQAAAVSDDVEQGLIDPPLKNLLQRIREDFRNQHLHLLMAPTSSELLPLLLAALPKEALPSLRSDPFPLLYRFFGTSRGN